MKKALSILLLLGAGSCSLNPTREPQADAQIYESKKVSLLKLAATQKILFQIPEISLKDISSKSVGDSCRSLGSSAWSEIIYDSLDLFSQQPDLFKKFHVMEIKRGDQPGVEINKDLDGGTLFTILYSKKENRSDIKTLSEIPCQSQGMDSVGKTLSEVRFEGPSREKIAAFLRTQPDRAQVARFNINPRFLQFLAERQTIFRITPDLGFEKSIDGESLFTELFKDLAERRELTNGKSIDHWLKEITLKSKMGQELKFFTITKDLEASTGIRVFSLGPVQRRINGIADTTFPYISYKIEAGKFVFSSLDKLENCLENMSSKTATLDSSADSYLYPGYHCR